MAGTRDPFLDGLRAVSVVRVILLHLLQRVEHPFIATFSFFMPGMPLMFFVSGALAAKSLSKGDSATRKRFWSERARRLLIPFWVFGGIVLGVCAVGAIAWPDAAHAFPFSSLWRWVLPIAGPQASAAYDKLDWHTWFLSVLILMIACAPWTLASHRRWPGACALLFFAAGATLEVLRVGVPDVVRNTLLFGAAFQFGFAYGEGQVQRIPRWLLLSIAGALATFSLLFYAARAPNAMLHAVPLALVTLGLAFVALWMCARPMATRIFDHARCSGWIRAINKRAYTIYLWGPVANDVAGRLVRPSSAAGYALDFALALSFLALIVRVLGPVEDWAARRNPKRAPLARIEVAPTERAAA
jgi:peptidoglycan/LPS O-acetylase OafA/YrhL